MLGCKKGLSSPAIGRNAGVRNIKPGRELALLEKHVNGNPAARKPVAADPYPLGRERLHQPVANPDSASLMEGPVVAERLKK